MIHWKPTATIETLKQRAIIVRKIRQFFYDSDVLEVETPLLSHATATDPYIHSFKVGDGDEALYLQTSPEYAMKRLLAAGSGSIFQICKAFRKEEQGQYHQSEFTMLEWYRLGFSHHDLMENVIKLVMTILGECEVFRYSYAGLFQEYCGFNPHMILIDDLKVQTKKILKSKIHGLELNERDLLLQLLLTEIIEPQLSQKELVVIYDFPVSQAALSKIRQDTPPVAERFEAYFHGIELANGFHELQDAEEQKVRFQKDLDKRQALGYSKLPIDERLLGALKHGLPKCSGVALGVDRLVMAALKKQHIHDVITFPMDEA